MLRREFLRRLADTSPVGILVMDRDGQITFANPRAEQVLGLVKRRITERRYNAAEWRASRYDGGPFPDDERPFSRVMATGQPVFDVPLAIERPDGQRVLLSVNAAPLRDAAGRVESVVATLEDVSRREQAMAAARESERLLQQSQRVARLGSYVLDVGTGIWTSSTVLDEIFGIDQTYPHDVDGWTGLIHPDARSGMLAYFTQDVLEKQRRFDREYPIVRPSDGSHRWVHGLGDLECDAAGRVVRMLGTIQDITERRRADEALRSSQDQYRALVDGVRDVIFALSPDGVLTALNPVFEEITGWSRAEWLGRQFAELLHPADLPGALGLLQQVLRAEPRPTAQLRVRTRDGGYRVGEFRAAVQRRDGAVVGILGIVRDITDRLTLEEQFRQAQKMEAVGQLAGGVAHDFNNLLTVISSYSELVLGALAPDDERRADLEEIQAAAARATALTRQLLAFSRRQVLQPTVLSLNAVVTHAENLLGRLMGEDVALVTRLDPALGSVKADAGQLEQVIMNLAVNARDAMPGGGTLTIETRNVEIGGAAAGAPESVVPPGGYVLLRVADTGTGMDAGTRARIFEPFFTTKEPGKGTGLGLATVYGIVKQSGGYIFVDSEPGRGAAFRVYLSRLAEPAAAGAARPLPPKSVAGSETVLLVEDEEAVRAVACQSLRRLGYTVLEARNGESAAQLAAAQGAIAILVTDVVMPGMNGRALADRLRARRPRLKVLFVSGYADNAVLQDGVLEPGLSFLQKPFTPEGLAQKVREVLDG